MALVNTSNVSQAYNLVQNQIDVYLLDYTRFYHQAGNFKSLLSGDELSRAQRYQSWALQDSFIVQHGLVRQILGYHLQASPGEIEIDAPMHGKPQVKGLHFNISHTDNFLAVAVSKDVPVGIDIESMDRNVDLNHVAAIVLSDSERSNLFSLPKVEQKLTLLATWVCKEAFWKYVGEGLNSLIKQFELIPTAEKDVYSMGGSKIVYDPHKIQSIAFSSQRLLGAVAYKGVNAQVTIRTDELPVLV